MKNPLHMSFGAVFQNEVLLNSKRVAPYALILIFSATAVLGWGRGPAIALGWATNSDFYIARGLKAFSFLFGLPIFTAVIMGDSVIRDFRLGIDQLIFSKPVNRLHYLLGKFFGNFFVLVCCAAAYPLTLMVLQAFRPSQMVVQEARVLPYFKHFLFFVVITQLMLAAFYFAVGALTRNSKLVYGLAFCFYPIYVSTMLLFIRPLPVRWKIVLDIFMLNSGPSNNGFGHSAEFLNSYVVNYTTDMLANRLLLILIATICLTFLYRRFVIEQAGNAEKSSVLNLSTAEERVYYDSASLLVRGGASQFRELVTGKEEVLPLPKAAKADPGIGATISKLISAVGTEFRLLRAERSFIVLTLLIIFLSMFDLAFYRVVPEFSYSASYTSKIANTLLLFLVGLTVFYTGEAMHRDRELRILPVLWAAPIPNSVLLFGKFLATLLLGFGLAALVGATAIATQLLKGDTPVNLSAYFLTYSVIILPNIVFLSAIPIALNVLLRDKYVTYAVSIGIGGGLLYLYNQGYNHWLYNPLLYQLWNYADLTGAGSNLRTILMHRLYCLAIAGACLSFALLFFQRKAAKGLWVDNRLTQPAWAISVALVSVAIAALSGWSIISSFHRVN